MTQSVLPKDSVLPPQEMEALAFGYAAAKNACSAERTVAFCSEDFVFSIACAPTLQLCGHAAVSEHLTALWEVFPDLYSGVDRHVVGPQGLVAIGTLSGTMRGAYLGSPATGLEFAVPLVSAFEYDSDRIARETNFVDMLALFVQVGIPPGPVMSMLKGAS